MKTRILRISLMCVSICGAFLGTDVPRSNAEPGYSIRLLNSIPKQGTRLTVGEHITLSVTVACKLSARDRGEIALVLQKDNNARLMVNRDQVKMEVNRGAGEVTLTDEFDVPDGTKVVRLFVPLVPEGYANTSGEILIEYPVVKRKK